VSDLRERIAAVLYTRFTHALPWDGVDQEPWLDDADAVIADLGLEEERTYGDMMRRHVTDWEDEK